MDDVRTLAHAVRRRRQANRDVSLMLISRSVEASSAAYAQLGAAAREAMESAQWAVATFDVQLMWERACAAPH